MMNSDKTSKMKTPQAKDIMSEKKPQVIDRIGIKINSWTIIEKSTGGRWVGQCRCGEKRVKAYSAFQKDKQCAACLKSNFDIYKPGDILGKWTITSKGFKKDSIHGFMYECKCVCGKKAILTYSHD